MPCLRPRDLTVNGLAVKVVCQKCSECRKGKVRDLVGRVLAEKRTAIGCHFVTLTYGVDRRVDGAVNVKGADVLTYSHFRKYLKTLRNAGYPMRYLVAGEYGALKSRAHFHAIIFWTKRIPPIPKHTRGKDGVLRCWDDPWWKPIGGGHTQYDEVTGKTARYVCKYCLAPEKGKQAIVRRSTRPLLGAKYFDHWAKLHVKQELAITNRYYTVPGSVEPKSGKLWNYYMNDATLRYVVQSFKRQWQDRFPGRHMPPSAFLERQFDKVAVPMPDPDKPLAKRGYQARPAPPTHGEVTAPGSADRLWTDGETVFYDEKRHAYWCEWGRIEVRDGDGNHVASYRPDPPVVLWWSYDEKGEHLWSPDFVSVAEGKRRAAAFVAEATGQLSPQAERYAEASGRRVRR